MEIAEVIGTDADPLRHIIVINRGPNNKLKVGQTVLDDMGIMGQIIDVYPHSSRVMLLSDKEHSLSVRLEHTGMRAIVSGTGDLGRLKMEYVPTSANIKVGEKSIARVWDSISRQAIWSAPSLKYNVIIQVNLPRLMWFRQRSWLVVIM